MKYKIDKDDKKPVYLQLYEQLREDITGGLYQYGSKLPSKRVMADELGISTITVEHTYGLLLEEGYIDSRERSGFYVIFSSCDGFASSEKLTVLRSACVSDCEDDSFPFSVLSRTMRRVLSNYDDAILKKSPNSGLNELREAIARYLARNRGINVSSEQIIIGSGAEYLYGLIVELLGNDIVYALESPSYEKIEKVYRAANVKCDLLPLGADGIDGQALTATEASVLHITPYRSFPSGITASASKRYEYLRWADTGNKVIVEDDFESEFSVSKKNEETLFALSKSDNVIYLNTFSKTISPSIRVGYMVLPKKLAQLFEQKLGFYSCTVPTFEQYVLTELITQGDFERHINRVRRKKRQDEKNNCLMQKE